MLRRLASVFFLVLLSSSCSVRTVVTYDLKLSLADESKALELVDATERVLTRKLKAKDVDGSAVASLTTKESGKLTIKLKDKRAARVVADMLAELFVLDIRIADETTPPRGQSSLNANQPLDWVKTGLTGDSLDWIQVIGDNATGQAGVELKFNAEGRKKLSEIFAKNKGKALGVFVRDLLISKVKIETATIGEHIVISGIPSFAVGEVFADDVNVGLHVQFIPTGAGA